MGHTHVVTDTDARFVIDIASRKIKKATGNDKLALMQYDHNSERYTFEMPRHIEGHDMSACNLVGVHYLNIEQTTKKEHSGLYEVDDLKVSEEDESKVVFSWLIKRGATQHHGKLHFLVSFACTADGLIEYAWHTDFFTETAINKGLDATGLFETEYVEIIERWKNSVMAHFTTEIDKWKTETTAELKEEAAEAINGLATYVTPQMFGAAGDGVIDDLEPIQAAIDAGNELNKPVVFVGEYLISSSITLRRNTVLYGYNASLYYTGSDVCIKAEGTTQSNLYAKMYGLSVRSKSDTPAGIGISVKRAYMGMVIEDCGVYGFDVGIDHSSAEDGVKAWLTTISRCRISNCNTAVVFNDESNGCNLLNCLINGNNNIGVKLIGVHNVNITECEFESNGNNGGCAIFLESSANVNISRCYFEGNGANVSESHVILFSQTGTNYSININNNWIHASKVTSAIKIREAYSVNIVGNSFYGVSDTSALESDIDMTETTGVYFFIVGNQIAAGINYGSIHQTAMISYDNRGFLRNTLSLNGASPVVTLNETSNDKTMQIMHVNNKMRFYNNDGEVFLQLNGDAKTVEKFAVQRGSSENRPADPPSGTMYYDTTLLKPIWAFEKVWRTADGTVVS